MKDFVLVSVIYRDDHVDPSEVARNPQHYRTVTPEQWERFLAARKALDLAWDAIYGAPTPVVKIAAGEPKR